MEFVRDDMSLGDDRLTSGIATTSIATTEELIRRLVVKDRATEWMLSRCSPATIGLIAQDTAAVIPSTFIVRVALETAVSFREHISGVSSKISNVSTVAATCTVSSWFAGYSSKIFVGYASIT